MNYHSYDYDDYHSYDNDEVWPMHKLKDIFDFTLMIKEVQIKLFDACIYPPIIPTQS